MKLFQERESDLRPVRVAICVEGSIGAPKRQEDGKAQAKMSPTGLQVTPDQVEQSVPAIQVEGKPAQFVVVVYGESEDLMVSMEAS